MHAFIVPLPYGKMIENGGMAANRDEALNFGVICNLLSNHLLQLTREANIYGQRYYLLII